MATSPETYCCGNISTGLPYYLICGEYTSYVPIYYNTQTEDKYKKKWTYYCNDYRALCLNFTPKSMKLTSIDDNNQFYFTSSNKCYIYKIKDTENNITTNVSAVVPNDTIYINDYNDKSLSSLFDEQYLYIKYNNIYGTSINTSWLSSYTGANLSKSAQQYLTSKITNYTTTISGEILSFYNNPIDLSSNSIFEYIDIFDNTFIIDTISSYTKDSSINFAISVDMKYGSNYYGCYSKCFGARKIVFSYKNIDDIKNYNNYTLYSTNGNSLIMSPSNYEGSLIYSRLNFEKFLSYFDNFNTSFGYFISSLCFPPKNNKNSKYSVYYINDFK